MTSQLRGPMKSVPDGLQISSEVYSPSDQLSIRISPSTLLLQVLFKLKFIEDLKSFEGL